MTRLEENKEIIEETIKRATDDVEKKQGGLRMTREEKEQTSKYLLQMANSFEKGCYRRAILLRAAYIIDELLDQEEPFMNKPCVAKQICHENKIKVLDKIKSQILDEAEYAYADFDRYKEDILHAESDELPDDDFRYGLQRTIEIINEHISEAEE